MAKQLELSDSQWDEVKDFFETGRKRKHCLKTIVSAILWILRSGSPWRLLDSSYPKWEIVYYYFNKWNQDGSLDAMNEWLNRCEREQAGRQSTPSLMAADSQSTKLGPFIEKSRGLDGNKKVNGRKRQILVDTLGLVWAVFVHAANISDTKGGVGLIDNLEASLPRLEKILIDHAYQGTFEEYARQRLQVVVEVAAKPESTKGFIPVAKRWVVERTFAWLNFYRRLSKDYEQNPENSAAWILWANSFTILKRFDRRNQI
jgi:putative transposase